MKKVLCLVLTIALLVSSFAFQTVFAADDIKVLVNGKSLTMDQPPVLVNDRTLVPVRAIFEALGAKVDWNNDTNTATGELNGTTVEIQIENTVAKVNGKDVTLDVPAKLISDRTLVPVRFISESLGAKVDWEDATQTVVITMEEKKPDDKPELSADTIYAIDFDSVSGEAGSKLDAKYGTGAASGATPILDKTVFHSGTTSVRVLPYQKTTSNVGCKFFIPKESQDKLVDGETYTLSAYIYLSSPAGNSVKFNIKGLNGTGASVVAKGKSTEVKNNEWTKVAISFKYEKSSYPDGLNIRIDTGEGDEGLYYSVDDVSVTKGAAAIAAPSLTKEGDYKILAEKVTDAHRPVPTSFTSGKSYDDLLFFGDVDKPDNAELVKNLPEGKTVIDDSLILDKKYQKESEYGKIEEIKTENMPFEKAIRVTVSNPPEVSPYSYQMDFGTALLGKAKPGDVMLLKLYMRTVSGGNLEAQTGRIQAIVEQNGGVYDKAVQMDAIAGSEWKVFYAPFEYKEDYVRATLRLGYYKQVVEIGGYEIINYENKTTIDKMPSDSGNSSLLKNATWRKDAWNRIEEIRKGDFKVVVKDANGKAVKNAKVSLDMYEHDFEFGTAIHDKVLNNEQYQKILQENFNTIALENNHKPRLYEQDPILADNMVSAAKELGIKNARGHCLVWDKAWSASGPNTATTDKLNDIINSGDRNALEAELKRQIEYALSKNKGVLTNWDVLNEAQRNDLRYLSDDGHNISEYGLSLIKKIFDWARNADPSLKLYYNDYIATGELVNFVKKLKDAGVDFDGVGMQLHNTTGRDITSLIQIWDAIGALGKDVKVTEYDMATDDLDLQANFTRDMLIAAFSHEAVDGFVMWGFAGSSYVLYDYEMKNAKPALSVWQDLIYNKWWTNEEGNTGNDGSLSIRGFYGDYDITVTGADGKTVKQTAHFSKDSSNTVEIVLK